MTRFICAQCGTQFAETPTPPEACPICQDERQYVRWSGQEWTTPDTLQRQHRIVFSDELGIRGINIEPSFAIGQRALLVPSAKGHILWDCVALVTDDAVETIRQAGGIEAIAISHPHYYTAMVSWSEAFGGVPIYLHEDDRQWVMHPHPAIRFWSGETLSIGPDLTLIRSGGHYEGSTLLHDAKGEGTLYVGDNLQVCSDRRHVSFMRSYPNYIPLNAAAVKRIGEAVAPFRFGRVFGAFRDRNVAADGNRVVERSIARYLAAIL